MKDLTFRIRAKTGVLSISFLLVLFLFFSSPLKVGKTCSGTSCKGCSGKANKTNSGPEFEWLHSARVFLLDAYAYPLHPNIEFDAEKLADLLVDMNFNTVRVATSGWYYFIPDTPFKTHPQLNGRDILAECIAACKKRGIRVVPYVRAGGPLAADAIKDEWAHRMNPKGEIHHFQQPYTTCRALCWNTSYRQAFAELIEKIVTKYDIDGMYFDAWMPTYCFKLQDGFVGHPKVQGIYCYCEGCRKGFKKDIGAELPFSEKGKAGYTAEELEILGKYRPWSWQQIVEAFYDTKKLIKSHKNVPLIFNINNPILFEYTDQRVIDGQDAFLYERGDSLLERVESISVAVSHGLAVWPYIGGYDGLQRIVHDWFGLGQEIYTAVAFGGSPIIYQGYLYVNNPHGRKPIKDAFAVLKKNEKYISKFEPYKYCAVVHTRKDPPGHARSTPDRYNTNTRNCSLGAFESCIYSHLQTTSLFKQDLDKPEIINKYKVLYLADMCYVSDSQVKNLQNFVKNGGGLILSYATGLYDENGDKRSTFALGSLAGVEYLNPDEETKKMIAQNYRSQGPWDLYLMTNPGQSVIRPSLSNTLIAGYLYEPVKALPDSTVVANMVTGTNTKKLFPGLVVSNYGKGKVAYIAPALDSLYSQTHIREVADFLMDVIEYVSPQKRPYQINAPDSLISNMMVKDDTYVLHMANWTGCKFEKIHQKVYYIPPIENVKISCPIPKGKKVKNVGLFIPAEFSHSVKNSILYVTLPKVNNYQAVIIEME
jgi:hypothetical protein